MVHNKMHKDRLNEKANSEGKKSPTQPKKNPSDKMRRTLKHAQKLSPTFLDDIIHLII